MVLAFLQRVGEHLGGWFYLIAAALTFAEASVMVGLVFPGEAALLTAGLAAHQGWIALWPMVAIAVVAAAAGDSVGYEIGRGLGPRLRRSWLGRRIGQDRWTSAEAFLVRHGGKAVLLGRFTAVLRAVTPGMAGMAHMAYLRTFLPWNVAGAVLWGGGCVLLGYAFSASLAAVGHYLTYGPLAVVGLAGLHLHRRRARRASGAVLGRD